MREYTYGELYAVGKHGDIFEVSSVPAGLSPSANVRGKKIAVRVTSGVGSKVLVKPEKLQCNGSEDIITPTGNWTGAKYRKVEQFISIPFYTAMERLQKGLVVYYKTSEGYTRLSNLTHIDFIGGKYMSNFDDLIYTVEWYYKK